MSHATALAAMAAAPRASRAHRAPGTARASSRPWRRAWAVPSGGARGRPQTSCAAEREAGDASTSAPAGALSIIDSTDDVFAEFCAAQVELVARALGRGARCMLYLRASGVDGENLQLTEVASYPPSPRWDGDATHADATRSFETAGRAAVDMPDDAFGAAASSFADSLGGPLGDGTLSQSRDGRMRGETADGEQTSITLRGGGSADEGDGELGYGMTATEALLVKQRVFALPSANALVVPLSRDDQLLGLLVGEMPAGGGWKGNSARTRKERERKRSGGSGSSEGGSEPGIPEVEVLSATSEGDETKEREAQDTAEKFGDRRKAALAAAARSVVAAWAMHRRADYATAAAIRSDERVEGFVTEAREPLTVLRTLGGMLSTHLKPESPSRDMAEAIVAQGDVLAELSSELESALYPRHIVDELAGAARAPGAAKKALGGGAGGGRALPAPGAAPPPPRATATAEALASGASPSCDVTPLVAGLLASAEVMARPAGVTMTATFPEGDGARARARADPRDARETLALVIDAALVAAPRGGSVDVVVSANGGLKGGVVVAVGIGASASETAPSDALPAGALSAAAARTRGGGFGGFGDAKNGDAFASETRRAATSARERRRPQNRAVPGTERMEETQSLQIARSLVEGAGGIFHALPSLPPAVGRVEMWWPAAEDGPNAGDGGERGDARVAEHQDDAVDVYTS